MEDIIEKITTQFSKDDCVEIVTPFAYSGDFWISGEIMVKFKGLSISFEVTLPITYPMTQPHSDNISINFVNKDLVGYSHINNDGSVCFHPAKDDNFNRKIRAELVGLKKWIFDYYVNDKEDERYTYLNPPITGKNISTIYFGENPKQFQKGNFGIFKYSLFSNQKHIIDKNTSINFEAFFRIGFDKDNTDDWSEDFLQHLHLNYKNGIWCYLNDEPIQDVDKKRLLVSNWNELQNYLSKDFLNFLYNILKQKKKDFFFNDLLFFTLGYKIPTAENYETHWQLIKVHKNDIPVTGKKISNGKYDGECTSLPINWGLSKNTGYHRFFGRGKLSDKLTNSRILLIGIGALGSSLAEILVRGGVKNICIDDFDIVETGNLCRANYTLANLNFFKTNVLQNRLLSISPFVNIKEVQYKINCISNKVLEEALNDNFDFIFDCSTDPEVSFILDNLQFTGKIFSLGLTNNARHLTCVTGDSISQETAVLYDCLEIEPASFFEGTGCGYPTFNANFNDINTVLNLSVKKINETLNSNKIVDSFYIKNLSSTNPQIEIVEYVTFFQKDIKQYLLFPIDLFYKIETALIQHYPKEFGGIFIGYKSPDFHAVIVENILLPDKYKNGKAEFIRHPQSLNERLDTLFQESNGRVEYLGEFHSHPNAPALPSKVDENSMAKIAKASKVTTDNPILMIGKIDTTELVETKFYIFNKKKLYEYEQQG